MSQSGEAACTVSARARRRSRLFLLLYVVLALAFLLEAAVPSDDSAKQTSAIATLISQLFGGRNCRITVEDGRDLSDVSLCYDTAQGVGELIRLYPSGGTRTVELVSDTPSLCSVHRLTLAGGEEAWFLSVHATGTGRLTLTTDTDGIQAQRTFSFPLREGTLSPQPERHIVLSTDTLTVGDTLTVRYGQGGDTTEAGILLRCSDEGVLQPVSADPLAGSATFRIKRAGEVTLSAYRLTDDNLLEQLSLSVPAPEQLPVLQAADGTPIDGMTLLYSRPCGYGTPLPLSALPEGCTLSVSGSAVLLYTPSGQVGHTRYLIPVGAGTCELLLRDADGHCYPANLTVQVTEQSITEHRVSTPMLSTASPLVGSRVQLSLGAGRPLTYRVVGEAVTLYREDPLSGSVELAAECAGTAEVQILDLLSGAPITSVTITVGERPSGDDFSFYRLTRKGIGHFSWCAVMGLCFFLVCLARLPAVSALLLGVASGASLAALSEAIQALTPGRSCLFSDMCLDLAGYLLGYLLAALFHLLVRRWQQRSTTLPDTVSVPPDTDSPENIRG